MNSFAKKVYISVVLSGHKIFQKLKKMFNNNLISNSDFPYLIFATGVLDQKNREKFIPFNLKMKN